MSAKRRAGTGKTTKTGAGSHRVRGRKPAAAAGDATPLPRPGARPALSPRLQRAREIAALGLVGGSIDPDEHLYRSMAEGPRDLPAWTHERQIELAWGLHESDPLAKRIIEITKDYVVADGLTYEVEPSEAEKERERRKRAQAAKVEAERKAAQQAAALEQMRGQAEATQAQGEAAAGRATEAEEDEAADDSENLDETEPGAPAAGDPLDPEGVEDDGEPTCEELQAVLERHWRDPDNDWALKQHDRATGLGLWGEQIYPCFVNPVTGHVRLGWIDPRWVKAIQTDPENQERVVAVVVRGMTGTEDRIYRVVHVQEPSESGGGNGEGDPAADGFLVGATKGSRVAHLAVGDSEETKTYAGTCFYFAANRVQGAKRGHSDLLALIDWIDAYSSLLFDGIDAASQKGSFIWDVTLEGATQADVDAFRKKHARPPRKGAVRVHNERVKWEAVSPDLQASQHVELARLYRVHCLGGAGLPEHWYGDGDSATRATASEMSAPVLRRLKARQSYFCSMVEQVLRFQVDQAILAGEIRGTPETKLRVKVRAPEFEAGDVAAGATALSQGTSALVVAEDRGWVTKDTARKGFAAIAQHLGVHVDAEAERAALDAREEAGAAGSQGAPDLALLEEARRAVGDAGIVPPRGADAQAAEAWRVREAWLQAVDNVGIFLPIPLDVAAGFPERAGDDSPPHVTLLYVGALTRADLERVQVAAGSVARWTAPFAVEMTDYGEFTNPAGQTIAHMIPRTKEGDLEALHRELWRSIEGAGVRVLHHPGPWKPHATLAYVPEGQAYAGPRPSGTWRADAIEIWAFGQRIRLPLVGCAPPAVG